MPVYRSRRPQVTTQRYRPQVNPACRVSPSHICPSPASSQSRTLTGSAQTSRPRCRQGGVTPFQQKSQLFTSRIGCALGARAASPQMPGCEQAARPTPARLSAAPRNRMQSTPLTLIPFMSRALKPRPACQALLRTARHAPGTAAPAGGKASPRRRQPRGSRRCAVFVWHPSHAWIRLGRPGLRTVGGRPCILARSRGAAAV
jgi:hypothetical protein